MPINRTRTAPWSRCSEMRVSHREPMVAPSMPPSVIATPMGKADASGTCRAMQTRLPAAAKPLMRLTARFNEIAFRMR